MTERSGIGSLFFLCALYLQGQAVQSVECGNLVDAQTNAHRSKQGSTVVLQMHAEDDHAKDEHMCMSDYSFTISRADGNSLRQEVTSVDDTYGRAMKFWIDGFTDAGQRVIATISDSTYSIVSYDLRTGEISIVDLAPSFLKRLGDACTNTLMISGVTRAGAIVVSTGGGRCGPTKRWSVKPGLIVNSIQQHAKMEPLPNGATIEPIE